MKKENKNNVKGKKQNQEQQNQSTQIVATVLAIAILIVAVVGISFAAFTYSKAGEKTNTITTGSITMVYTEGQKGINIDNAMPVSDTVGKAITPVEGAAETGTDLPSGAGHLAAGASGVFDFTVTATISGTTSINYDIVAHKTAGDLDGQYVKLYLEKSTQDKDSVAAIDSEDAKRWTAKSNDGLKEVTAGLTDAAQELSTSDYKLLHSDNFSSAGGNHFYRLRMWVASDYGEDEASAQAMGTQKSFTVQVDVYGQAAA